MVAVIDPDVMKTALTAVARASAAVLAWQGDLRWLTAGRPGLLFSIPVDPGGGVGLKHTLPYWYSLRVALNSLGGCEVLLASTCIKCTRLAQAYKRLLRYLCLNNVTVYVNITHCSKW